MTRTRLLLLLILGVLLGLLLFGTPLYGRQLLARVPGDYAVRAESVGGPLWHPVLRGATVTGPGLRALVETLRLGLAGVNLKKRELRFSGSVRDAEVDLDTGKLLSGQRTSNWRFLPQNLDLRLTGHAENLSDGRVEVIAEGERADLERLLHWLRRGPPHARVENVDASWNEATGLRDFYLY